ncbi:Zn-dependent peptidase ImmA (M78 family)/DNA-binding XRE family transcriptional regulator [Nonomuraea thailandensis]|uniref:Zn-dependent peptidase ImmA (M78 family)/DNA-binding XRE family transcriptional regulator n=1 Tax=Nonomuraea thailandensis TaxID=1188745 RepID=A0A9X2GXN0_9ACTN|nr:XRE family transcriptional regulator [Nonomuraea thailandensis]MCP2365772.1 Zn-dependent peptidase ImmA (M78 family)/DNA-binding XRE family transcriptional regulator [Nonomuraea thailandensis]
MSSPSGFFAPSRLVLARKRRGLTVLGLAQLSGVSPRSVSAYERGERSPSPQARSCLADALDFPEGFFLGEDLEEVPEPAISFRAAIKHTAGRKNAGRSAARIGILINEWVEERVSRPDPDVPRLPGTDPETAAQVVRISWGLGQAPVSNMIRLLERHGVRVYALPPDCADVGSFSLYWRGVPFLFLGQAGGGAEARVEAAHELAHLVLHRGEASPASSEAETAADEFAAHFLMPAPDLLGRTLYRAGSDRIQDVSRALKVPGMALAHRLRGMGLLDGEDYRSACANLHRFAAPFVGGETSQVLTDLLTAGQGQQVRPADIARQLRLTREDVIGHLHGLAPVLMAGNGYPMGPPPGRPPLRMIRSS